MPRPLNTRPVLNQPLVEFDFAFADLLDVPSVDIPDKKTIVNSERGLTALYCIFIVVGLCITRQYIAVLLSSSSDPTKSTEFVGSNLDYLQISLALLRSTKFLEPESIDGLLEGYGFPSKLPLSRGSWSYSATIQRVLIWNIVN